VAISGFTVQSMQKRLLNVSDDVILSLRRLVLSHALRKTNSEPVVSVWLQAVRDSAQYAESSVSLVASVVRER